MIPVRVQADSRAEAVASAASLLLPTEEGEFWHGIVRQLIAREAINAMVRELALQSQLVARDTDQWLLRVERESLNQSGSRDRLATALQAAGHAVRLVVEIGRVTDSPARRNAALVAERQLAAEKIIFDDPFVQAMMRDFGAKIVPGSISSPGDGSSSPDQFQPPGPKLIALLSSLPNLNTKDYTCSTKDNSPAS